MNLFLFACLILFLYMNIIFFVAMLLKDNSIVDVAYGLAFVLTSWGTVFWVGMDHPRQGLLLTLITLWGGRLSWHIFMRKQGENGEDFRYRQWRESWGKTFVWRSYLQIFLLQGSVVYLVLLPFLLVLNNPGQNLTWLDWIGLFIWIVGFLFEAIGDWQLLKFKNIPKNKGHIIKTGMWRYTRHPNYFGEAVLWWGVFCIALSTGHVLLAVTSPLLINFLLLKVSGIPMLEAKYEGNPEFLEYKRRTNAFFPWFPKNGAIN